jgi:hypothetical protein
MREILHELGAIGPTALDVTDAKERHTTVARTLGVSLGRLTADRRDRYLELAVFGEDVPIPSPVLTRDGAPPLHPDHPNALTYYSRLRFGSLPPPNSPDRV